MSCTPASQNEAPRSSKRMPSLFKTLDAGEREEVCHEFGVHPVVVVAEDGVDAAARAQPTEHVGAGLDVLALVRDVVARQRDDVGLEAVGHLDGALDLLAAREGAVVDVREVDDAEAVEFAREPPQADGVVFDGELVRLGERRARELHQSGSHRAQGSRAPMWRHVAVLSNW